jgi:ribosome-binding ATPase YchF (GTP1/OBG family)
MHVEGEVNPLRDMDIIQTELRLKDVEKVLGGTGGVLEAIVWWIKRKRRRS